MTTESTATEQQADTLQGRYTRTSHHPPSRQTGADCRYLAGIGKAEGQVKLLLDCKALFNDEKAVFM